MREGAMTKKSQGDDREVRLQERDGSSAIDKIVLNMGVGEATQDKKKVESGSCRKWS
jgi:ribosomal protein L5